MDLKNLNVVKIANQTSINGKKMQILEFTHKDKSMISRKEMKKICKKYQETLKKKYADGIVSVSIKYNPRWFSADSSRLNDDINFMNLSDYEEYQSDPEEYQAFRFIFVERDPPPAEGGKDENNDCLIKCIQKALGTSKTKFFIVAEELKQKLGLARTDPIPITDMKKVEQYVNNKLNCKNDLNAYSIFVSGDHEYLSPNPTNKKFHITLSNGHYTLDDSKIKVLHCKSHDEKPILMIETIDDVIHTFDGEVNGVISRQEFNNLIRDPYSRSYTPVLRDTLDKKTLRGECIEDSYYLFKEMADEMKKHCGGCYNFYKCGSFKSMALNQFYKNNITVQPEPIHNAEATWIEDGSSGAIMYWQNYEGHAHDYDVNSRYPDVMQKNQHYFPIKEGEFKIVSEMSNKMEFGIYRCKITKADDRPYKFFRFNPKNKYTNLDIDVALNYGLTVELMMDDKPNALIYTKDKLMNGAFLFKNYIDELYELKKNKVNGAKALLNVLWGGLTESTCYKHAFEFDEENDITEAQIRKINVDDKIRVDCTYHKKKHYKTNWARIKPFVLAYARHRMFFCFRKFEPLILQMHTDGFLLSENTTELKTGPELGNLKYVGEVHVNIKGLNNLSKRKI